MTDEPVSQKVIVCSSLVDFQSRIKKNRSTVSCNSLPSPSPPSPHLIHTCQCGASANGIKGFLKKSLALHKQLQTSLTSDDLAKEKSISTLHPLILILSRISYVQHISYIWILLVGDFMKQPSY